LNKDTIRRFDVAPVLPEKVKSLEVGYRTSFWDNTFVDASYYFSIYDRFIGYQIGVTADLSAGVPRNTQAYRYAANSLNTVTTQGFSVGISHYRPKYLTFSGNYSWNVLNTQIDDPIIPAFNTPEHKFNLGVSGRDIKVGKSDHLFGFGFNYKWIQGFVFEGSPQFTGYIPNYDLLDGQVNYQLPKRNLTFKIGGSNLLNKKQFQTYGGPRIGRMAYVSLLYDFAKK
jgi:iron complex outermembrane recepter protein